MTLNPIHRAADPIHRSPNPSRDREGAVVTT
jgi:hypothetical protein